MKNTSAGLIFQKAEKFLWYAFLALFLLGFAYICAFMLIEATGPGITGQVSAYVLAGAVAVVIYAFSRFADSGHIFSACFLSYLRLPFKHGETKAQKKERILSMRQNILKRHPALDKVILYLRRGWIIAVITAERYVAINYPDGLFILLYLCLFALVMSYLALNICMYRLFLKADAPGERG